MLLVTWWMFTLNVSKNEMGVSIALLQSPELRLHTAVNTQFIRFFYSWIWMMSRRRNVLIWSFQTHYPFKPCDCEGQPTLIVKMLVSERRRTEELT